jgi:hypothetical protein
VNDDEFSDSDSDEEDSVPRDPPVPTMINLDLEESKADEGLERSRSKGGENSNKHFGYVDSMSFEEAVDDLE